jgi:phosphoribosylanthranilate isomerase
MTRVKICGITSAEDAAIAVEAGADALGFVFVPGTPRHVTAEAARAIAETLPPLVVRVGVFLDQPLSEIQRIAEAVGLHAIQLHGNEPGELARAIRLPVIKAIRIRDEASLAPMAAYPAAAFLLDTYVEGAPGGTGQRFPWGLAAAAVGRARIILAGGLTPANVAEAVRTVRPYGVDVSSGVEAAPGRKDPVKVKEFIRHVREADCRD